MCLGSDPPRDCNICILWRRAGSKIRGKRVPDGQGGWASGKCTWERGPEVCKPERVKGKLVKRETMPEQDACPHCGAESPVEDQLKCPRCLRDGCLECMPAGRGCMCPECEDGEELEA